MSASAKAVNDGAAVRAGPWGIALRWWILALLVVVHCLNYVDRYTLALLAPLIQQSIGWSEIDYGRIVGAFQFSYALCILAGGAAVDRLGTRWGVALALTLWSLAQLAHVLAGSALGFGMARAALAVGEAMGFAGLLKAMHEWFPDSQRGFAAGTVLASVQVLSLVTPLFIPLIAASMGWQSAFASTGVTGLLVVLPWLYFYRAPRQFRNLPAAELAFIEDGVEQAPAGTPVRWATLLRQPQLWAYTVAAALAQPVSWFIAYWVPKYLASVHGVSGTAASRYLAVVALLSGSGAVVGGWWSSRLIRRGLNGPSARRRVMLATALVMPIVGLAPMTPGPWSAALLAGLAAAGYHSWGANNMALLGDLIPARAMGSAVGISNLIASFIGILTAELTGRVLEWRHNFYAPMFVYCAIVFLVAYVLVSALIRGRGRAVLD